MMTIEKQLAKCTRTTHDCLLWPGAVNAYGYPVAQVDGKVERLHRYVYEWTYGKLESRSWHVHHSCNSTRCLNPKHLVALTASDHAKMHRSEKPSTKFKRLSDKRDLEEKLLAR